MEEVFSGRIVAPFLMNHWRGKPELGSDPIERYCKRLSHILLPRLPFNNILRSSSSKRTNNCSAVENRIAARRLQSFADWRAACAHSLD